MACALVVGLSACPGVAGAAADPPDPGQTTPAALTSGGSEYRYLLYTPTTYQPGRAAPLLVVAHGCQTTAEQELRTDRLTVIAEREGFVLMYPDVDAIGRALPGPLNQCWKFPYPPAYFRGNSDTAAIADMTRAVMAERDIDAERVYLVGISAGGLMTSANASAYSDLYAAVGIIASAGYADASCFTTGISLPAALTAQLAFAAMGDRARVVPRFVIGSTGDLAFPAACSDNAMEQGLRTNNLAISGGQTAPLSLAPATVRKEQKPGGRSYTVSTYRDPDGCLVGERTIIDGMAHSWPGGTSDPAYNSDPTAPSGAEIAWAFLRRFTKSETSLPCAEAPAPVAPAPAACPARRVTLPRWTRLRVLANGRRVKVRRRTATIAPAKRARTVTLRISGRRGGRARHTTRRVRVCGRG